MSRCTLVVIGTTPYALGQSKRKSKAVKDLLVFNMDQNIAGCLNSTFTQENLGATEQLRTKLVRFLETI